MDVCVKRNYVKFARTCKYSLHKSNPAESHIYRNEVIVDYYALK